MSGRFIDETGNVHHDLYVLYKVVKNGRVYWHCKCKCGNETDVRGDSLRSGHIRSCGCLQRERATTHGLTIDHGRLLGSVTKHIENIRNPYSKDHNYYKHLRIPAKYLGVSGAARFVREVISRYPEKAEEYESNKGLEVDKDISREPIFAPWNIRFVTRKENINNKRNTVRLNDGTPLAMFCSSIGIETRKDGSTAPKYQRIFHMWAHRHKVHPELMQALKEDTDKQLRLLSETVRRRKELEALITGLEKLLASKSDTLDMRPS